MIIQKVKLESDDIILLEIDDNIVDLDQANHIYMYIKNIFPNHQIIAYLKGCNIHITKEKNIENLGEIIL